jgi:prepilin peptidase CpaA
LEDILQTIISLVGLGLFIVAAYSDVRSFRIPNLLVGAVALLAVARLIVIADPIIALYTVGASIVILITGFALFSQEFVGGGDAKLLTATALLVGYSDLLSFLLYMSICGAFIALAAFVTNRQQKAKALYIPYGVAIATAGSLTLLFQSSLATSFIG